MSQHAQEKRQRQIPEDEEYDPTEPEIVNGKEWMIQRINHEGKIENYAGAWPRAMIENAKQNPTQDWWVGISERSGREFGIKFSRTFKHILLLGATGGGKTIQLYNLLTQAMFGGHGMAVCDPKADDLFEVLLRRVPEECEDDMVYVDVNADYIRLEHPETGEEVPYQTGFNILEPYLDKDDEGYDAEIEWITTNFMQILDIPLSWTKARRDLKTMIRGMARHEEEYTPIEVYYALSSEENRQRHVDLLGEDITDDNIRFIESHMKRIAEETSDSDLDPLLGKLSDWIQDPIARNAVACRNADITLGQVVMDQMLLFVNTDLPEPVNKMVANLIKTGVWSAVKNRLSSAERKIMQHLGVEDPGEKYAPFYLAIDEAHAVFEDDDNIEKMMFEARSKKLGLILSTQKLRSLPDDAADAILSEAHTALVLKTQHPEEQRELAKRFGGMEPEEFAKIPEHHAITKLEAQDDPFLARLIPPYPPLRTIEETAQLLAHAVRNWGAPVPSPKERLEELHYETGVTFPGEDGEVIDPLGGDEEAELVILKRLYDEQIRHDDVVAPTELTENEAHSAVSDEFDIQMTQASQIIEELTNKELLRSRLADGGTRISVTSDALKKRVLSSGSGGAGGGPVHRELLRRLYIEFTRLGYNCEIPSQEGDELPDLIGHLPPELDDLSLSDALDRLREKYPQITVLSDDGKLIVEVECSGISKPGGPVKNLADIMTGGSGKGLFAVADGGSDGFTNNARLLSNIFTTPPMTNPKCPNEARRLFYTKNPCPASHVPPEKAGAGTEYAIHPDPDVSIRWLELPDGDVVCRTSDGEEIARYDDIDAFRDRSPSDFPGVRYADPDQDVYVAEWTDESGERHRCKRATKEKIREEVTEIKMPAIPEHLFDGEVPSPEQVNDAIDMVIVPDEPADESEPLPELQFYDICSGETTPMSEYLGIEDNREGRGAVSSDSNPQGSGSEDGSADELDAGEVEVEVEDEDAEELSISERLEQMDL